MNHVRTRATTVGLLLFASLGLSSVVIAGGLPGPVVDLLGSLGPSLSSVVDTPQNLPRHRMAFLSNQTGSWQVCTRSPLRYQQLTNLAGGCSAPSVSKDGRKIVFIWHEDASNAHVCTMDWDGSGFAQVTTSGLHYHPCFSPDRSLIAFEAPDGVSKVYRMSAGGGPATEVGVGAEPEWVSVEGTEWIYHTAGPGTTNEQDAWRVRPDKSVQERLTNTGLRCRGVVLCPDGTQIMMAMRPVSGDDSQWEIYKCPATGGTPVKVTDDTYFNWYPACAIDRGCNAILYSSKRDGQWWIVQKSLEDGSELVLTDLPKEAFFPATGCRPRPRVPRETIVFVSNATNGRQVWLWDGCFMRRLTNLGGDGAVTPTFSPDGSKIAFCWLKAPGERVICTVGADGTGFAQLTSGNMDEHPTFSPDGGWIAFARLVGGTSTLFRMPATGGTPEIIATGSEPVWSTLGTTGNERIYHTAGPGMANEQGVWWVLPDGSEQHEAVPDLHNLRCRGPALNARGTRGLVAAKLPGAADSTWEIWKFRTASGYARQVTDNSRWEWYPGASGRGARFYCDVRIGNRWLVSEYNAANENERILTLPGRDAMHVEALAGRWLPGVGLTSVALVATTTAAQTSSGAVEVLVRLSTAASVHAKVTNLAGRPVATIAQDRDCDAGLNTLVWSGRATNGLTVPNGMYMVNVTARTNQGEQVRSGTEVRVAR